MKYVFVIMLSMIILSIQARNEKTSAAQDQNLKGPILVGQARDPLYLDDAGIVFQDVGTGRVWKLKTPKHMSSSYEWFPDGCKLLLPSSDDFKNWMIWSVNDFSSEMLPSVGTPMLSFDSLNLFFIQYHFSDKFPNTTNVYVTDIHGQHKRLLRSDNDWLGNPQWLSNDELLYLKDGYDWFVWNIKTDDIYPFYSKGETVPSEVANRDFYSTNIAALSPDHTLQAGYYDLPSFRGTSNSASALPDEIAEMKPFKPHIPGFDIYFLKNGTHRHVDINGQFVQSIVWSASNKRIAITTDYDGTDYGVYVYDIDNDTLQRVGDAYNDFSEYYPSWSPDEKWLAFRTPTGFVIQNLADGKRIPLDEQMNGYVLSWSPVMDYSQSQC